MDREYHVSFFNMYMSSSLQRVIFVRRASGPEHLSSWNFALQTPAATLTHRSPSGILKTFLKKSSALNRQTDRQASWQTDRRTERQTSRGRQTGRPTGGQADRKTPAGRQANRQTATRKVLSLAIDLPRATTDILALSTGAPVTY